MGVQDHKEPETTYIWTEGMGWEWPSYPGTKLITVKMNSLCLLDSSGKRIRGNRATNTPKRTDTGTEGFGVRPN